MRSSMQPKHWILAGVMTAAMIAFVVIAAVAVLNDPTRGDFKHFYYAAEGVRVGGDIYSHGLEATGVQWYLYLPLFALVLSPLTVFPTGVAGAIWAVINGGLIVACLLIGSREAAGRLGVGRGTGDGRPSWAAVIGVSFPVLLVLGDKFLTELKMGQSDAFVLLWMLLALMLVQRRPFVAGCMLGPAVNVKLQGLVFVPYFIVRGRWRELGGLVVSSIAFALVGALVWGWETNNAYLGTSLGWVAGLLGLSDQRPSVDSAIYPLEWIRSVSVPSVLRRAELAFDLPTWTVLGGTFIAVCLATAAGWLCYARQGVPLFRGRSGRRDDKTERGRGLVGLEWMGLLVGVLIFSPQSTVRHFFLALFVCATASAVLHAELAKPKKMAVGICLVLFLLGMTLPPGGGSFEGALHAWRAVGGATWCLIGLFYVTLWAGLDVVKRLPSGPIASSSAASVSPGTSP